MQLWRISKTTFNLRVFNSQFMGLNKRSEGINIVAILSKAHAWNTSEIVRKSNDLNRVHIGVPNGKYGIKVSVDLHAAPGSQNGNEHSGTRDGSQEWGKTDENIQQTVAVIDFLAARYAMNPSLIAVELINEPLAPGVSFESLTKFYRAGYDAVRKYSSIAYVIMSNQLGPADSRELLPLAGGLKGTVIDIHYYNLFSDEFKSMTVQQNIDFVYNNRANPLNIVTTSNGPLTFVGEWVAEWDVNGATEDDHRKFAKAQLEVYGRATFRWAYWAYKHVYNHWSLRWMIENNIIAL